MNGLNHLRQRRACVPSVITDSPVGPHWYAAYTCARHEKKVARQLELRCLECFLPLYEKLSHWKDRRVKVQVPLFSGYVFVRLSQKDWLRALQIPGMVHLVGFNGRPTPLPDEDILTIRNGLSTSLRVEPCPYVQVGRTVRILSGPLTGLEGILQKKKSGFRFVVSLHIIQRSVMVELQSADLQQV